MYRNSIWGKLAVVALVLAAVQFAPAQLNITYTPGGPGTTATLSIAGNTGANTVLARKDASGLNYEFWNGATNVHFIIDSGGQPIDAPINVPTIITGNLGNGADIVDLTEVTVANGFIGAQLPPGPVTTSNEANALLLGSGNDNIALSPDLAGAVRGQGDADWFYWPNGISLGVHVDIAGIAGTDRFHIDAQGAAVAHDTLAQTVAITGGGSMDYHWDAFEDLGYVSNHPGDAGIFVRTAGTTLEIDGDFLNRPAMGVNIPAADVADVAVVTVVGGNVKVNGQDPEEGPLPAATVTDITFRGRTLNDVLDLSGVTAAGFTALTATSNLAGDDGDDEITGSEFADTISGGNGNDTIHPSPGADTITGNGGDDTIEVDIPPNGTNVTVDGNADIDTLIYDAKGNIALDTGGAIIAIGFGNVTYSNVENIVFINMPAPVIELNPPTMLEFSAVAGTVVTENITVSNKGINDLTIDLTTVTNGSHPGAFSIVGGSGAPPDITVTSTSTHLIQIQFDDTIANLGVDEIATGTLRIDHDSFAQPTNFSIIQLTATRTDHYVWATGTGDWFTSTTLWNPTGFPQKEDTAEITGGHVNRATTLNIDGGNTGLARDTSVSELTITDGALQLPGAIGINIGVSGGVPSVMTMTTGSLLLDGPGSQQFQIGFGAGAQGLFHMHNGTFITANGGGIRIGEVGAAGNPCFGHMIVEDGIIHQISGTSSNVQVARSANSTGLFEMRGGLLTTQGDLGIALNNPSTGTLIMTGGRMELDLLLQPGVGTNSHATIVMSGGEIHAGGGLDFGSGQGSMNILEMNGGVIEGQIWDISVHNSAVTSMTISGGTIATSQAFQLGAGWLDQIDWTGGRLEPGRQGGARHVLLVNANSWKNFWLNNSGTGIFSPGGRGVVTQIDFRGSDVSGFTTNYAQGPNATLEIDIDGATNDRIWSTSGTFSLGGTLDVNVINLPTDTGLIEYVIVDGAFTGTFAANNVPSWLALEYRTLDNQVVLVKNDAPQVSATATPSGLLAPANETLLEGVVVDLYPDPGGALKGTTWTLFSAPGASTATLTSPNTLITSATLGGTTGTYVFMLEAMDLLDTVGAGSVSVQLFDSSNLPPVVDAGPDRDVGAAFGAPIVVTLAGSVTDPESQPTSALWTVVSTPFGGGVTFVDNTAPDTAVTLVNAQGDYVLRLTGSDGFFQVTDDVVLTVIYVNPTAVETFRHWQLLE